MTRRFSFVQSGVLSLLLTVLWIGPLQADEQTGFAITAVDTELRAGVYRLNARIHFELTERVIEAMQSGVPQVIEIDMQVVRPREYLWNETLAAISQRYEIAYHALSERYVVTNLNTASRHSYPSLGEALYQIGLVRDFPLIDAKLLPEDVVCFGEMRARLDIESLPTPIRLVAYTNRSWWLGSDWKRWPLQR